MRPGRGSERPNLPRSRQLLLLGAGYCSLALAAIGAVLPLMPTTVFLLIAAWCFGRASPALRERLHADRRFGPALRNWERHGTISPAAKRAAVLAMALSWLLVALAFRNLLASSVAGACILAACALILTRPSFPSDPTVEAAGRPRSGIGPRAQGPAEVRDRPAVPGAPREGTSLSP